MNSGVYVLWKLSAVFYFAAAFQSQQ